MKLREEYALAAQRHTQFTDEEGEFNREDYRDRLLAAWRIPEEETATAWAMLLHHYLSGREETLREEEALEEQERRAISDQMQQVFESILLKRAEDLNIVEAAEEEGLLHDLQFLLLDDPQNITISNQNNPRISNILASGNRYLLNKLVEEQVGFALETLEKAAGYSDQELAQNGPAVLHAAKLVENLPKLQRLVEKSQISAQTGHLLDELEENYQYIAPELKARMELIANPLYRWMNPETVMGLNTRQVKETMKDNPVLPKGIHRDQTIEDGLDVICRYQQAVQQRRAAYMKEEMAGEGRAALTFLDPRTGKKESLENIPPNEPICVINGLGEAGLFLPEVTPQGDFTVKNISLRNRINRNTLEGIQQLSKQLEEADPFYIKSSKAFRDMKQALNDLKATFLPLTDNRSDPRWEDLRGKLDTLQKLAQAYGDYKRKEAQADIAKKGQHISSPLEQSRLQLGQWVEEFAGRQAALLSLREPREVWEDWPRLSPQEEKLMGEKQLRALKLGKNFAPGTNLERLYQSALVDLGSKATARMISDGAPSPEDRKFAKHLLATLTILETVLQERAGTAEGTLGKVEQTLLDAVDPDSVVRDMERDLIFQAVTQNLTGGLFAHFLERNGERILADAIRRNTINGQQLQKDGVLKPRHTAPQQNPRNSGPKK